MFAVQLTLLKEQAPSLSPDRVSAGAMPDLCGPMLYTGLPMNGIVLLSPLMPSVQLPYVCPNAT